MCFKMPLSAVKAVTKPMLCMYTFVFIVNKESVWRISDGREIHSTEKKDEVSSSHYVGSLICL